MPALLLLARALPLPRRPLFYVTISGLGGEPDYDQRFKMWAEDIDSEPQEGAAATPTSITLQAPTREQIRANASRSLAKHGEAHR